MNVRKTRIMLLRLSAIPFIYIAIFVRPTWMTGSGYEFLVELAGYAFLLAGLAVRMWSILYIGGKKSRELVTEGPYSLCRNPLYVGTFLLAVGAGLCFANLMMLAAILLVFVPAHLAAAVLEEGHLESLFPTEYPAYKRTVPGFMPLLKNYKGRKELVVPSRLIRRIMMDTIAVLLIPEVEDLLEVLHSKGLIPTHWHFP